MSPLLHTFEDSLPGAGTRGSPAPSPTRNRTTRDSSILLHIFEDSGAGSAEVAGRVP